MKLQKLLYFAYGWYYASFDTPLFNESIFAWTHGPVVAALYGVFKGYGKRPIAQPVMMYANLDKDGEIKLVEYSFHFSPKELNSLSEAERLDRLEIEEGIEEILQVVWRDCSDLTAIQLRNLTHMPETPWRKVYDYFGGNMCNAVISPTDIYRHFQELQQKYGGSGDEKNKTI
jgi:uncharacterized phage-associated protein